MPKGELFINGYDAYTEWGISMDSTGLSALMAPAPNKERIENKSRAKNGKQIVKTPSRKDERDLNLIINLSARNESDFFDKYLRFCHQLDCGDINIQTKYQPGVVYRTQYRSCQQFTQFIRRMATFGLKLTEPDPTNRSLDND